MSIKHFIVAAGLLCLAAAKKTCKASALPTLDIFGLEIIHVETTEQKDFAVELNPLSHLPHPEEPISFCNVTVTYTHPGQGDVIHAHVWMPLEGWNGRLIGQGGGGYMAGGETLGPAVALGYAAANTDAGHTVHGDRVDTELTSKSWALASKGNVNWTLLQDFAYRAIEDLPKIVIEGYYGEKQKFSYWNGCSTGGRQGMMLAQRAPEEYDGILAIAPAINWATFVPTMLWPQVLMKNANYFPAACEFEAIRQAAIRACDGLDGVEDGMVAAPGLCDFDAGSIVGQIYDCEGDKRKISKEAASLANAIWAGPKRDGKQVWFGYPHETILSGPAPIGGMASTTCDDNNKNCKPAPFIIAADWVSNFVMRDTDWDISNLTEDQFWSIVDQSEKTYASIISADSPDLSSFKGHGGKLLMWHGERPLQIGSLECGTDDVTGLADQAIFANGSTNYYERVEARDPQVRDFFRLFESPGAQHCFGGHGVLPTFALESLVEWVESGKAPQTLNAASAPSNGQTPAKTRILCPYPQVAVYQGGDENDAASFQCGDSYTSGGKSPARDEL
nr:putative feruloyl esterase [Quercus suber]